MAGFFINLGPAGFTHKNVFTFLRGPNKPRDDKGFGLFFLLCHSGARPRNPGGARETRVQKYFDNFIDPVPACAGMTKNACAGMTKHFMF